MTRKLQCLWIDTIGRVTDGSVRPERKISGFHLGRRATTYKEMPPAGVRPVQRFSHASPHSRTMFSAYLCALSVALVIKEAKDILLVLAFARESELVLRLSVRDLVDTEPLVGSTKKARQMPLHVLNVIKFRSQGIVDVDDDHFPVGLLFVEQRHNAKNLDLLHLTRCSHELADLTNVQWVVITLCLGLRVGYVGVLPGLMTMSASGNKRYRQVLPEERHHSSRCTHGGGSNCGHSGVCPF